jgi:DNA-binding GntR family transcriptional regulator
VSRELLGRKVADVLRRQIILGQMPDGARLVEDDLAARFGVSRGPIREAFTALERERLVRTCPGKGTYVRALTEDSVRQLFAVRTILEVQAAELAARRVAAEPGQAAVLRSLAERFARAAENGHLDQYAELDHDIHRKIWELSGNEHLADVLG